MLFRSLFYEIFAIFVLTFALFYHPKFYVKSSTANSLRKIVDIKIFYTLTTLLNFYSGTADGIQTTLITEIDPDEKVKLAMNDINAAQR